MNKAASIDQSFSDNLYKTIEDNLTNEQFGVEELAREIGVSRSQLHRKLHDITGQSASQVIREYRLKKARELLKNDKFTVAEVAYQVGFGSPSYFNTCFHEYFGYPPGEVKIRKSVEEKRKPILSKKVVLISLSVLAALAVIYYSWSLEDVNPEKISEPLVPEKAIAFLPFKYLSEDPDHQYLADGIQDAITGQLSKIKDLRVTPRTSVEQYRETTKTARIIGEELNVDYLIEGSFLMVNDQVVRLIIQLVTTEDEDHIWSDEYDRKLTELFAVESEITQTIAKEIEVEINPEVQKRIESPPTENFDAYELFMQGQHYQGLGPSGRAKAIQYYEQAIALDPDYALAWLFLGWIKFGMGFTSEYFKDDYGDSVLHYTLKAIDLDPNLDHAYYWLGVYYNWISDDDNCIAMLNKALELNPNYAMAYKPLGWAYARKGQYKDEVISLEKGKKLAIGSPGDFAELSAHLAAAYSTIGDNERVEKTITKIVAINPLNGYHGFANLYANKGEWDSVKLYTDKVCAIDSGEVCLGLLSDYYMNTEEFSKALKYSDLRIGTDKNWFENHIYGLSKYGYLLSQLNRKEEARAFYDKQIYYCKEILRLRRVAAMEGVADVTLFETYIHLENHEMAIHHLKECEIKGFGWTNPTYLQVAPQYKPIWGNEEFKAIMKRQEKKYADIRAEIDQLEKEGKL